MKLQIGCVSVLCILISISACSILCSYYRSVPYIKKNILTRLDELYVINFTFLACLQCLICLFSLLCEARNDYVYLVFFFIVYGSVSLCFEMSTVLSVCRVFIIMAVSGFILLWDDVCCQFVMQNHFTNLLFQPAKFHNLHHELVYRIVAVISVTISFTYSFLVGIYYFNTNRGTISYTVSQVFNLFFRQCPGCCGLLYWNRKGIWWSISIYHHSVHNNCMHDLFRNNGKNKTKNTKDKPLCTKPW